MTRILVTMPVVRELELCTQRDPRLSAYLETFIAYHLVFVYT